MSSFINYVVSAGLVILALAGTVNTVLAELCALPAEGGCSIGVNQTVRSTLQGPDDVNQWRLTASEAGSLNVVLTDLGADYDLHVYRADGTLVGESTNEGAQDDSVNIDAAAGDAYVIYVNSARGDISASPYTLRVENAPTGGGAVRPGQATPGQVLLSDTFDDPLNGWLPVGRAPNGTRGYVGGEYQLAKTDISSNTFVGADVPGVYGDSSIALDVRVADSQPDTTVMVRCRLNGGRAYRAELRPENRTFALSRLDGDVDNGTYLAPSQPSTALRRGAVNHVELSCVGSTISLSINDVVVTSVRDAMYTSGIHQISSGIAAGKTSDVRLANLVITQR